MDTVLKALWCSLFCHMNRLEKKNICQIWVKGLNSSPVSVTKVLHELYHMRNVAELTVMVEDNDNRVLRKVPDSQLVESGLLAML